MPEIYNPKLDDVRAAYNAVPREGGKHQWTGEPAVPDMAQSHVQGVAQHDQYMLLTHSNVGYAKGFVCVINTDTGKLVYKFDTPDQDFNHPGGIQTIGDFLVLPVEKADDTKKSYVHFLDLRLMNDTVQPSLLPYYIYRDNAKAGAAGITNFTDTDSKERYVLAVYDNGAIDVYKSDGSDISSPSFRLLFSQKIKETDASSICLLTDVNQNVYFIAFRTKDLGGENEDKTMLYKIDLASRSLIGQDDDRHMVTKQGPIPGWEGVHFRWGAGLKILSSSSLRLYATQRNFTGGQITTNTFEQ